jgi:hypothetical protein
MTEIEYSLGKKIPDKDKLNKMLGRTESRIKSILNSMPVDELVPKRDFKSEKDFENHVLSIIKKVRNKLFQEMKNSFDEK